MKKPNIDSTTLVGENSFIGAELKLPKDRQHNISLSGLRDLTPSKANEDDNYLYVWFRGLSEVVVHKQWNPIDFSVNEVLKPNHKAIIGQVAYTNHDARVGNEKGYIKDSVWEESYSVDGTVIPAGFNIQYAVKKSLDQNLVDNLTAEIPLVHSSSVSVMFKWEKSHPKLSDSEFWWMLGSMGKDGQLIRRVATDIINYSESSFVAHGADPYAQIIKQNKIINPMYAQRQASKLSSLSEKELNELSKNPKYFIFDFKEEISLSTTPNPKNNNSINNVINKTMDKKLSALLNQVGASNLGLEEDSEAIAVLGIKVSDMITKNQSTESELKNVSDSLTAVNSELSVLKLETETLKAQSTLMETELSALKEVAKTKLKLVDPTSPAASLKEIDEANFKTCLELISSYEEKFKASLEVTCKKCGSKEVTSQSSQSDEGGEDKGGAPKVVKSNLEVLAELRAKANKAQNTNS